jgi:hypothetical protein
MRQYADISLTYTGHSAPLRLAYRFESEKLLDPAYQVDPIYTVHCTAKTDLSKIVAVLGAIFS